MNFFTPIYTFFHEGIIIHSFIFLTSLFSSKQTMAFYRTPHVADIQVEKVTIDPAPETKTTHIKTFSKINAFYNSSPLAFEISDGRISMVYLKPDKLNQGSLVVQFTPETWELIKKNVYDPVMQAYFKHKTTLLAPQVAEKVKNLDVAQSKFTDPIVAQPNPKKQGEFYPPSGFVNLSLTSKQELMQSCPILDVTGKSIVAWKALTEDGAKNIKSLVIVPRFSLTPASGEVKINFDVGMVQIAEGSRPRFVSERFAIEQEKEKEKEKQDKISAAKGGAGAGAGSASSSAASSALPATDDANPNNKKRPVAEEAVNGTNNKKPKA